MKRMLWMILLALALPVAAFGNNQVDFLPQTFPATGTLTGGSAGLLLTGSMGLSAIYGLGGNNYLGNGLGTITLTTGPLVEGSLSGGGVFGPGGSLVITGSGKNGAPAGVLFSGTFTSLTSWGEGGGSYYLLGLVFGTLHSGGRTFESQGLLELAGWVSTGGNSFTMVPTSGGNGNISISPSTVAPEPGTLGLLGTGLAACIVAMRRKVRPNEMKRGTSFQQT